MDGVGGAGAGVSVTGVWFSVEGVDSKEEACGVGSEDGVAATAPAARIPSRLRTAAFIEGSRPFLAKADKYNSNALSDCKTGDEGS